MIDFDDDIFNTSMKDDSFDLRYVKNPKTANPVMPKNPDLDSRYSDVSEVVEEVFSDNMRIGRDKRPYDELHGFI